MTKIQIPGRMPRPSRKMGLPRPTPLTNFMGRSVTTSLGAGRMYSLIGVWIALLAAGGERRHLRHVQELLYSHCFRWHWSTTMTGCRRSGSISSVDCFCNYQASAGIASGSGRLSNPRSLSGSMHRILARPLAKDPNILVSKHGIIHAFG